MDSIYELLKNLETNHSLVIDLANDLYIARWANPDRWHLSHNDYANKDSIDYASRPFTEEGLLEILQIATKGLKDTGTSIEKLKQNLARLCENEPAYKESMASPLRRENYEKLMSKVN